VGLVLLAQGFARSTTMLDQNPLFSPSISRETDRHERQIYPVSDAIARLIAAQQYQPCGVSHIRVVYVL
jgi:hypothetical protein